MRLLMLIGLVLITSCAPTEQNGGILEHQHSGKAIEQIREGDIILRAGRDQVSQLFKMMNTRDQRYSHCGVVLFLDKEWKVCHIIGSFANPNGNIILEPLNSFINKRHIASWAIVRYSFDSIQNREFVLYIKSRLGTNISFDNKFDLATSEQMYCSELVYKALLNASRDANIIGLSSSKTGKKYVAIDNLYGHNKCKTIGEIIY